MTLKEKIRLLRTERGWTQLHLAKASGIDERTIRRIEGGAKPSLETLQALANAFRIDCSEFTTLLNDKPKPHAKVKIVPIQDGHDLLNALSHSHAYVVDAQHTDDEETASLIRAVLEVSEIRDIWDDLSASEKYEEGRRFTHFIHELRTRHWYVTVVLQTSTLLLPSLADIKPVAPKIPNWVTAMIGIRKLDAQSFEQPA